MEEARRVLQRLHRIEALERGTARPETLLEELRGLLRDAEAWARLEGGERAACAVERMREALDREVMRV